LYRFHRAVSHSNLSRRRPGFEEGCVVGLVKATFVVADNGSDIMRGPSEFLAWVGFCSSVQVDKFRSRNNLFHLARLQSGLMRSLTNQLSIHPIVLGIRVATRHFLP
jgi:hypothetical protein